MIDRWPMVNLTDMCKPKQWPAITTTAFQQTGYPIYGANGKIGYYKKYNHKKPTILIACRGTCGELNISEPFSYVTSNAMALDNLNENKMDLSFLYYFLRIRGLQDTITGTSQPQITRESLGRVSVPLPLLSEQKHITSILGKADHLRHLRHYARELNDTYLLSVFLEMFGDPVKNPMRWERAKISDLGKVQTGNTPPRDNPSNYGNYIEWLKSDNIIEGDMFVSKSREMLSEQGAKIGRIVEAGSVLVTCIAGSQTSIGNVALTDYLVAFNQQINSVTPHKDVDSLFLYGLLKVAKPLVQRSTTLGMKRIITKSNFENLVLIKPPQPQQQRFAGIIHKFEHLRCQQREAERQAEHLFQTLLHRTFRGDFI